MPVTAGRSRRLSGRFPPLRTPARLFDVLVLVAFAVVCLVQSPGEVAFDTKLDLLVDPGGFLSRALHAWDLTANFGQLQNQAYGYLFPIGPLFWLADVLGLPPWLRQAGWAFVVLAVGYVGVRWLCRRLGFPAAAGIVAALAYVCAPRMVTVLGPLSAEAWPVALLPFVVAPLLGAPALSRRRAAGLSVLAVLLMGAANAALTLALLPGALVALLARRDWRLAGAWFGFLVLASVWWVVPLVVQGRFATPFLSLIESAQVTTGGATPVNVLRGVDHWVAGIVTPEGPWWPAGFALATTPLLVAVTVLLGVLGLLGLVIGRVPHRRMWALLLAVGFLALALGSAAAPQSPVRAGWLALLDGALVAFRNVHKFDPLVRLPLSVGLGALTVVVARLLPRPRAVHSRHVWRVLVAVPAAALVAVAAAPWVTSGMRPPPTWEVIPSWWEQAAAYVDGQEPGARALLVPGSGFGEYQWGRTVDEPFQPLAASWAVQNQLPLGSLGSARVLDAVSAALQAGARSAGLADLLARSGVRFVVVRNDLDVTQARTTSRARVHATLDASPGLLRVASFGPTAFGDATTPLLAPNYGIDPLYPAVEVYRVTGPVPAVSVTAVSDAVLQSGGPEGLLPVLSAGLVERGTPVVMGGDAGSIGVGPGGVVTDSMRRRERAAARVEGNLSATMTTDDPRRLPRTARDIDPFGGTTTGSVGRPSGFAGVTASSSLAYADSFAPLRPERAPYAALDGDPSTWWQSADLGGPVGQWLEVRLSQPVPLDGLEVTLVDEPAVGPTVTKVTVGSGSGSVTTDVSAGGGATRLEVPPGPVREFRLTVTAAQGDADRGYAGVREVSLPGLATSFGVTAESLPAETRALGVAFQVEQPGRDPCLLVGGAVRCNPAQTRDTEEPRGIDRTWFTSRPWSGEVSATARIGTGPAAAALYDPVGEGIRARATSWLGSDVRVRPSAAVDGDAGTPWLAGSGDAQPRLDLDLGEARRVTGIRLEPPTETPASAPTLVEVDLGGAQVRRPVLADGRVLVPAVRTDHISITVLENRPVTVRDAATGFLSFAAVGVGEVRIDGAGDLVYRPDPRARTGAACGLGPVLEIGGRVLRTKVDTTLGDVLAGSPALVIPCGSSLVRLTSGWQRATFSGTQLAEPLTLTVSARGGVPTRTNRSAAVTAADDSGREVRVGAGPESLLWLPMSANPGWTATLDGTRLRPTRVDGWQQAWILPAGGGGTVLIRFGPERVHQLGLALGAALVVLFLLVLCWPGRTALRTSSDRRWPAIPGVMSDGAVVAMGGLLCGLPGLAVSMIAVYARRSTRTTAAVLALCGGALVVGAATRSTAEPWAVLVAVLAVLTTCASCWARRAGHDRRSTTRS